MRLSVDITKEAEQDIDAIAEYLAVRNLDVALRFLNSMDDSTHLLCSHPNAGRLRDSANKQLAGIRQ